MALVPEKQQPIGRALQPGQPPGSWFGGRPSRVDFPALLASWDRRRTHCTRCARFVQTCCAKSEVEARCARVPSCCAARPLTNRPATARAAVRLHGKRLASSTRMNTQSAGGSACRRAICARPRAQRSGSGARSALQHLTWRHLFERSEPRERSEFAATDPRSEHRGKSARQSRPGHHEHGGGPGHRSEPSRTSNSHRPTFLQTP